MVFKPNRRFKKDYNRLFKQDPGQANLMLLLCELAGTKGQVKTTPEELAILFDARFEDPEEYQL